MPGQATTHVKIIFACVKFVWHALCFLSYASQPKCRTLLPKAMTLHPTCCATALPPCPLRSLIKGLAPGYSTPSLLPSTPSPPHGPKNSSSHWGPCPCFLHPCCLPHAGQQRCLPEQPQPAGYSDSAWHPPNFDSIPPPCTAHQWKGCSCGRSW